MSELHLVTEDTGADGCDTVTISHAETFRRTLPAASRQTMCTSAGRLRQPLRRQRSKIIGRALTDTLPGV